MKSEKKFGKPEAEIINFLANDIITTSIIDEYDEDTPISQGGGGD